VIIYIAKSGALLERMAKTGVDIVSLDWTVTIEEARLRMGNKVRNSRSPLHYRPADVPPFPSHRTQEGTF
jgi:hypothetical protein